MTPNQPGSGSDNNSTKGLAVIGLAVGYDFKPAHDIPLRAEFEYAWRGKKELDRDTTDSIKVGAQSFFLNGYFDIHNSSPVTPYIGAGLGLASVSSEFQYVSDDPGVPSFSISKTKTNFAWNVGVGAAWEITDSMALDLGYRYADLGKVDGSGVDEGIIISMDTKVTTHEVLLGLRFTF